jgi:hypothetical protein
MAKKKSAPDSSQLSLFSASDSPCEYSHLPIRIDADSIKAALRHLPKKTSQENLFYQTLASIDRESLWHDLANQTARHGLRAQTSPERATILLTDLMPYPKQSSARFPKEPENIAWFEQAKKKEFSFAHLYHVGAMRIGSSPYPVGFARERILELGRLGADATAAKSLIRATFRKSKEEVQAILELKTSPSISLCHPNSASALHRACYAGTNEIFSIFASVSTPSDWLSIDPSGKLPLDKAYMSGSIGRALAAARLTPMSLAGVDQDGDTPMHRLASAMAGRGYHDKVLTEAWSKALSEMADLFGPDIFAAKNNSGQTPIDLARLPETQAALLAQYASGTRAQLLSVSHNVPLEVSKPRHRL